MFAPTSTRPSVPSIDESTPLSRPNLLSVALSAATVRGFAVLPVKGKRPLTVHGYKTASRESSRITALFKAKPNATDYGIATGRVSGIVVADVDGPDAVPEPPAPSAPSRYVVCSPSGPVSSTPSRARSRTTASRSPCATGGFPHSAISNSHGSSRRASAASSKNTSGSASPVWP
jgi:hypothetical protein